MLTKRDFTVSSEQLNFEIFLVIV